MGFVIQQTQKTSKQRNFSKIVDRHSGNLFYSEELILAQTQKPHIGGSTAPERKDICPGCSSQALLARAMFLPVITAECPPPPAMLLMS